MPNQETVRQVQFSDVVWTGNRFVAVGHELDGGGVILDSVDGLVWQRRQVTDGAWPDALAVGPPGVVAIGTTGSRLSSWSSPDGISWTANSNAFEGTAKGGNVITVTDVVALPSGWLAVGREDPPCQINCGLEAVRAIVWTSADGLKWAVVPGQEALTNGGMNAVSVYDGGYVAAGVSGRHAAIWTSPDGWTWSRVPDAAAFHARPGAGAATDTNANGVAAGNGVVVSGADTNDGYGVRAWWSTDGVTWTSGTSETFEGGWGTSIGVVSTGLLLTGGTDTSDCRAGMWESADGRMWRCAATDAALDGFIPQAVASSTAIDLVVGLTTAGYDENSSEGVPGAASWRTSAAGSPPAAASASPSVMPEASPASTAALSAGAPGELVTVLDVRCGDGAPALGSDRVRASRDGVRIHVVGEPGWHLGIGNESGRESVRLQAAVEDLVLPAAPGDVTIDCADPTLAEPAPASALRIEDPEGWYRSKAIGNVAGSCFAGEGLYAEDARGKTANPVKQARQLLTGLQAGDVVERAGYVTEQGWVRVVRAGEVIGVLEFAGDGHGGWLLLSTTLCGSLSRG